MDKFRRSLEAENRVLAAVRDLCDASKHCGLNRGDFHLSEIKFVGGQGGYGGYGQGTGYGVAGAYGAGQPEPRQYTRNGDPQWLTDVFLAAFVYWEMAIAKQRAVSNVKHGPE